MRSFRVFEYYPPWALVSIVLFVCWTIITVSKSAMSARKHPPLPPAPARDLNAETDSTVVEMLQVDSADGRKMLRAAEVEWLEAAGNYLKLHTPGAAHLYRQSLATMQRTLDERRFLRVHRSAIINLEHVTSVFPKPSGDAEIVMKSGARVPLSRRYARDFHERTGRILPK
jgi:DNA-binding LytR/AlgR family response regulator